MYAYMNGPSNSPAFGLPIARYRRQKARVRRTNAVSQLWSPVTVDNPRNMKMIVSQMDDNIFMKYLMVVCDLRDMLASTYFFIVMPQKVQLKR